MSNQTWNKVPFEALQGQTFSNVRIIREGDSLPVEPRYGRAYDAILFEGEHTFALYHEESCCEEVYLEDFNGSVDDLINTEIISAVEAVSEARELNWDHSMTWSFYHLRTAKGDVTLRFVGSSNGYYSETLDLYKLATSQPQEPSP